MWRTQCKLEKDRKMKGRQVMGALCLCVVKTTEKEKNENICTIQMFVKKANHLAHFND